MASLAKQVIFFLLITTLSSSLMLHIAHAARDSQFFSKTPSTTNTNDVVEPNTAESREPEKKNQEKTTEPSFLPQNEESYGLYSHETGQLPPSSTTTGGHESTQPLHKYLPKNYNPVAYVTVPENTSEDASEFVEETTFDKNPETSSYNNNGEENLYDNGKQQKELEDFSEYRRSNYYRLGSDFNSPRETTTSLGVNSDEGFQRQQGMSDTRFLENGKYHYDVNTESFSRNHPYESLKGASYYRKRANENDFRGENYEAEGDYRDIP